VRTCVGCGCGAAGGWGTNIIDHEKEVEMMQAKQEEIQSNRASYIVPALKVTLCVIITLSIVPVVLT
jgi:hypothetical protein